MENETQDQEDVQVEQKSALHQVTPLSKHLAMTLFIILPFLGGYIGYTYAPEKVVEVEKIVTKEIVVEKEVEKSGQQVVSNFSEKEYVSPNGFSMLIPAGTSAVEEPAQFSYSPITRISGDFGELCISSGYGCGGVGMQGWTPSNKVLTTSDGTEMDFNVWKRGDEVLMHLDSVLNPIPASFSQDAQIQFRTTESQLGISESMLTSIKFVE